MQVRLVAVMLLALACGSCAISIPTPSSVHSLDVVKVRPEDTIGPEPSSPTSWRRFSTEIDAETIRAVHRAQTTFHFRITDCNGKFVSVQDLYVNGVALNRLSSMADAEFATLFGPLDKHAPAFFYIRDSVFTREATLCGQFTGGSYTLVKIYNKQFRFK